MGGYFGLTREAYALDLRQFAQWCHDRRVALFAVARSDIKAFVRNLEDRGRARATISRRLCTITCLYKYAVEEGLLDRSPAVHVRRPRLEVESNATGLDRSHRRGTLYRADPVRPQRNRRDRHGAARVVRRIAREAGVVKRVGPHTLRHAFITAALDAGVPLRDVQEAASHADPRTTMRYDRARVSLDRHATYIVSTFIAGASR